MAKWIDFIFVGRSKSGKTKIWEVVSKAKGYALGYVKGTPALGNTASFRGPIQVLKRIA